MNTKIVDVGTIYADLSALSQREQQLRQLFVKFQSALKKQEMRDIHNLSIEERPDEPSTRGSRSRITFASRQAELCFRTALPANSSLLIGRIFVYLLPDYPEYPEARITHIRTIDFDGQGGVLNSVLNFTTQDRDKILVMDNTSVFHILLQLLCDMTK